MQFITTAFFFSFILVFSSFLIGNLFPSSYYLSSKYNFSQKILVGISLILIIVRFSVRDDVPILISWILLSLLLFVSFIFFIFRVYHFKKLNFKLLIFDYWPLTIIFPLLITCLLLPQFFDSALFFQNYGPDLDGHLMSANLMREGWTHADLVRKFFEITGTSDWWKNINIWNYPDFRETVGVEFFLRSNRYGHAIFSSIISLLAKKPIWFGMFSFLIFTYFMIGLVVYENFRSRSSGILEPLLLSILVFTSQSYIFMLYEGVIGQLIATPICLFLILNIDRISSEIDATKKFVFISILISALLSFFSEGILIISLLFIVYLAVEFSQFISFRNRLYLTAPRKIFTSYLILAAITFLISPIASLDFITWLFYRINERFSGGIGSDTSWDVISILFSLPFMKLVAVNSQWKLIFSASKTINIILLSLLSWGCFKCKIIPASRLLVSIFLSIFLVLLIGNKYALWKVLVIFQPLFIYLIYKDLPVLILNIKKFFYLLLFLCISFLGFTSLAKNYITFSQRIFASDFIMVQNNIVIITPSPSLVYMKIGSSGPLNWLNRPWLSPEFVFTNKNSNLNIAIIYSCNAEGAAKCQVIKNNNKYNLQPGEFRVLDQKIDTILNPDGTVDYKKLEHFINSAFFGIDDR
jgi:hypothetical protein